MTDQRIRVGLGAAIACLAIACGSSEPAMSGKSATVVRCTTGMTMPCTCQNGRAGMMACQLDGTFGVCNCGGAVTPATPGAAGTASAPIAGTASMQPGGPPSAAAGTGGGAMQPAGGGGATEPPEFVPVMVDPADKASCMGGGAPPPPEEMVEVREIRTSDVVPGGFTAPGGTHYGCFFIEIDMPEEHHIVGWEGAIGGDRTIHHQQVSLSPKPVYLSQQGGLCGLPTVEYTWTGGTEPEWAPALAGYPIGGPDNGGKARFVWQTHFEGATTYSGGFNVYVTKKLRKYDAGNFEQGDVRGIMIPPMAAATHVAKCTPEMTMAKLTHPIYVFASMLHAHLTIRNIKAEHYRNGMLINTFGQEMSAGFGFFDQRFKPHAPCIEILPGDEIVTTCDYQNPFDFTVMGGEATNQEMCTIFMQYFPRLPGTSNNFCGTIDSSGGFNL